MPTMSQRAPVLTEIGDRVKSRPARQKHDHLDDDDKILILWGTSHGWTIKKIALTLPASQSTVKKLRAKFFDDPASVFELPVLVETFGSGYVLLAEDLDGQGHTTRVVSDEPRMSVFIPLSD